MIIRVHKARHSWHRWEEAITPPRRGVCSSAKSHYCFHLKHTQQQQLAQIHANSPTSLFCIVHCTVCVLNLNYVQIKTIRAVTPLFLWWRLGLPHSQWGHTVCECTCVFLFVCDRVWKLAYVLQRSTAAELELFWTDTAFQECCVWNSGFRKVLFGVPSFFWMCHLQSIHVACQSVSLTKTGCDEFHQGIDVDAEDPYWCIHAEIYCLLTADSTPTTWTVTVTWPGWPSGSDRDQHLVFSPSVPTLLSSEDLMWPRCRKMNSAAQVRLKDRI